MHPDTTMRLAAIRQDELLQAGARARAAATTRRRAPRGVRGVRGTTRVQGARS